MRSLALTDITEGILEEPLYHRTGDVVFEKGFSLRPEHLKCLKESGVDRLYLLEGKSSQDLRLWAMRKPIQFDELKKSANKELRVNLVDEEGGVVATQGSVLNRKLLTRLRNKNALYFVPSITNSDKEKLSRLKKDLEEFTSSPPPAEKKKETEEERETKELVKDIRKRAGKIETYEPEEAQVKRLKIDRKYPDVKPEGAPLRELLRKKGAEKSREHIFNLRGTCEEITDEFFEAIRTRQDLRGVRVMEVVETVVASLLENYTYSAMAASRHSDSLSHYLRDHALNMAQLAAILATELDYSAKQVLEVTAAAYLANVGMLYLDPKILYKEKLSESEIMDVRKAPILSTDILQKLAGVPRPVPVAAYQFRERLDGSGYPRQRSGTFIHPYSRIVSIVDSYDAMLAPRPWREAFLPYYAMEKLIHQTSRGQYDRDFLRAFLKGLSLFPIGSLVELDDGCVAWVIRSNEDKLDKPHIKVVQEEGKNISDPYEHDLREKGRVVTPLNPHKFPNIAIA